jgi:hypothetical protein
MTRLFGKLSITVLFLLCLGFFSAQKAQAIFNASDTISTSRPSAAAPLDAPSAATDAFVTVKDLPATLNSSALWLASDSAFLFPDVGQSASTVIVASMSASNIPSSNERNVYFTTSVGAAHHAGTTMITPITAVHTIKFVTQAALSTGYKIQIVFPGDGSNSASPSASGFTFNNEATTPTDTTCYDVTDAQVCGGTVASNQLNTYTFTVSPGTTIAGGRTIMINIGCTAQTSGVCTTAAPRLVNPTKGASASGTADNWKILVSILDGSSNTIESTKTVAATIESVQVQGTIEPYITFTIAGVNDGTTISADNSSCTSDTDITNAGINASATFVNMGDIGGAGFNIAAQDLTVTTNGTGGYVITATSSGEFINPATGIFFPDANTGSSTGLTAIDTPIPAVVSAGITSFGIHPCGADVYAGITWGAGTTGGAARYSNPWNSGVNSYYATLASYAAGIPPASRKTTVEYEATAATSVPAGIYRTALTYVATPAF